MECNYAQFDPSDFTGYSVENELGISSNCLPNLLKLITFGLYIVIFFFLFFIAFAGLTRELLHCFNYNASKRRFLGACVISIAHMARCSVFLSGSFNRGKYVLFPFTYLPIFVVATTSVREWYMASELIKKRGQSLSHKSINHLNYLTIAFLVFQIVGYAMFWLILPMVYFDDPWLLNWFFISGYVHTGVLCIAVCLYCFKVAHVLLHNIKPALEHSVADKKLIEFVTQLEALLPRIKLGALVISPMVLLVMWVPLTQTPSNPGLDNFFYFEFFVSVPVQALLMCAMIRVAWKDLSSVASSTSFNSGGSHGSQNGSHGGKSKDLSYTAEDINGTGSALDMQQIN